MPIVLKSGSLNILEPSGLVQACNGIALRLTNKLSFVLRAVEKLVEFAFCVININ
jgi:hypothetical protein